MRCTRKTFLRSINRAKSCKWIINSDNILKNIKIILGTSRDNRSSKESD
jgi:hypothetical protein